MSSNPNKVNYVVTYDSDINSASPTYLSPINNIHFERNIAPSDDNATITLAGIQNIESAREVYIYRQNSDGTTQLKFRGMTTNPTYSVASDGGLTTEIEIQSLWYMLSTRLFAIAGKSPPPLQPNTNPYIIYLNPTLGLSFGQLWSYILVNAFQGSYTTGHLPAFHLANLANDGSLNPNIPQGFTDFDDTVVNDNLTIQYMSISAVMDKLVTSALFNPSQGQPFLSEYRLDIGDLVPQKDVFGKATAATSLVLTASGLNPTINFYVGYTLTYTSGLANGQSQTVLLSGGNTVTTAAFSPAPSTGDSFQLLIPGTTSAKVPTVSIMLFDPTHSKLGNGNNRTGLLLGDNSLDPAGTLPANLQYPMDYVEFGVTNGYQSIDTIVFSEGDNIVSVALTYDYLSMNNSFVMTGGSFQGSDVVALPINNQRSIAEYGLKQINQTLNNVVDTGEIQRYIGTSINFFQHPIPNIIVKPDYVYASSHILYPGDYVLLNTPSLAGVVKDSNGNTLEGSYVPGSDIPIRVNAYTARIKTIDISWSSDGAEDITLIFTFPIMNVPMSDLVWNNTYNPQSGGSNAGGQQFMYTTVMPAAHTTIGKNQGQMGAALYQTGGDFITNRGHPITETVADGEDGGSHVIPDTEFFSVPIYAQTMPNSVNVVPTSGTPTKGDSALIYQLGFEVDTVNSTGQNTPNTPNTVYLTILQPDGLSIFDSVISLNQSVNILTLISQSHSSPDVEAQALVGMTRLTSTSATSTAMTDTDLALETNAFTGYTLKYTSGPATGLSQTILSNTNNTITTAAFSTSPTSGGGDTFTVLTGSSAPLLSDPTGLYTFVFRNSIDFGWVPDPLLASLPAPSIDTSNGAALGNTSFYVYCPVDSSGNEMAMSFQGLAIDSQANGLGAYLDLTWPAVSFASSYNVYKAVVATSFTPTDILTNMSFLANTGTNSYHDAGLVTVSANTQPFDTQFTASSGLQCQYDGVPLPTGTTYFTSLNHYWYLITANNPENAETGSSQGITPFTGNNTSATGQPDAHQVPEYKVTSTTTAGTTSTLLTDSTQTWAVNQLVNYALQYTSGPASGQFQPILSNTAHTITTAAFSPAPNGSGDTYQVGLTQIELSWPVVPYAQSYNVYRAEVVSCGGSNNNCAIPARGSFKQIAGAFANNAAVTGTDFFDDGVTYVVSSHTPPASYPAPSPSTNAYTAFGTYSFNPNPADSALVTAFFNNPNTTTTSDPTVPRTFPPSTYVAP